MSRSLLLSLVLFAGCVPCANRYKVYTVTDHATGRVYAGKGYPDFYFGGVRFTTLDGDRLKIRGGYTIDEYGPKSF